MPPYFLLAVGRETSAFDTRITAFVSQPFPNESNAYRVPQQYSNGGLYY